jgi:carbonic anhydrase
MTADFCSCLVPPLRARFDRRRLLQGAAVAALAGAFPMAATGAPGKYEAMLLSCIDPRIVAPVFHYMERRGLTGYYSQFVIAGAAVAVVAPKFEAWHETFWQNLAASIELHRITRVIAIDHRDCGAARIAYGASSIATPAAETATHKRVLGEFRKALAERHPGMVAETGLMALDGSFEILA